MGPLGPLSGFSSAAAWLTAGTVAGLVAYCNLPPSWTRPAAPATAQWLREARVKPLLAATNGDRFSSLGGVATASAIHAGDIWKSRAGAVVMAVRRPG